LDSVTLSEPDLTPDLDGSAEDSLPIQLLHDRILVSAAGAQGERKSGGGILIPATAAVGKRLVWARAVAVGPLVRAVQAGDQVLFEPEARAEVELRGAGYLMLRERDVHAVAASRIDTTETGLYL
jgi:chaperonin GroES